jgi:4-hydroxy-L-threonine phosphate dehydrogenase PdxA
LTTQVLAPSSIAPIAIAIGDPNGIGPEVAVKAAARMATENGPTVILIGDAFVINHYAAQSGFAACPSPVLGLSRAIEFMDVPSLPRDAFRPGQVNADAGRATVTYCAAALELVRMGKASAVVGCPHSEAAVNAAGINFSGYPGLLARLTGVPEERVFLMLVGGGLRIVHVTLHERLIDALGRLTTDLVAAAGLAAVEALRQLGIAHPRIGICGINPHASEGGLFGADDAAITTPAVAALRRAGVDVEGPIGADLLLSRHELDAFVAMYHDQGHIPIKLLAGRNASALTIGAGVLFSSVGHGSAFDIAGLGVADPAGVIRTLKLLESVRPIAAAGASP